MPLPQSLFLAFNYKQNLIFCCLIQDFRPEVILQLNEKKKKSCNSSAPATFLFSVFIQKKNLEAKQNNPVLQFLCSANREQSYLGLLNKYVISRQ